MTTHNSKIKVTVLALAVEAALLGLCAMPANAADEQEASLKAPANFINLGGAYVSRSSAKFGEYTGMDKSGGYGLADFGVRGGDGYGDGDGIRRWSFTGADLGLTSRAVDAAISDQGKWAAWLAYDELTHYTSDSYQTPYLGSMGGNNFTLPAGFAPINATDNTRLMTAAQLGAFRNVDVNNTRKNGLLGGSFILNKEWDVKIDYNQLEQSGAKLMGFASAAQTGRVITGETISILPMAQNYTTSTVNAALNWKGQGANATLSYFGSYFRDNTNSVSFQTWAGTGSPGTQQIATPPSNDFHQLNLTGGYAFSGTTKLAGGLSYARNTQNATYTYDSGVGTANGLMVRASPTSSLNGSVITTHADLKLTNQTTKQLTLTGGIKYDKRDNQTASNIYNSLGIDGRAGNAYNYPNTPLSNSKTQVELAGDYRIDATQKIRVAYNYQDVKRWCNNFATGGGTPAYASGTNCVVATGNTENSLGATYRLKASDDVNLNATYIYSDRKSNFDENARASMIGVDGNNPVPAVAANGISGQNGADYRGFRPFFEASRKQNLLKAGVNWQANEKVSVDLGGRYGKDNYDAQYGVQNGDVWSLNLDTTYAYRENGVISAYISQENRTRNQTNIQRSATSAATPASATALNVPPGATWSDKLTDNDTTLGLSLKQGGLMAGKLELLGDATYSLGKTGYDTKFNYASATNPGGLTCASSNFLTCVTTPDVVNRMIQFKLTGTYEVDKSSKVRVGYLYQYLNSADYYYNGLQTGQTPSSVLPTNQQPPSYAVNVVAVSYIYNFK